MYQPPPQATLAPTLTAYGDGDGGVVVYSTIAAQDESAMTTADDTMTPALTNVAYSSEKSMNPGTMKDHGPSQLATAGAAFATAGVGLVGALVGLVVLL